jgi:hypothetical protein
MTTAGWTSEELERIGTSEELNMAPLAADGTERRTVPIWVVRAGDGLYVRSWRGAGGGWFRSARASHAARVRAGGIEKEVALLEAGDEVNDAVDAAYLDKYGHSSYAEAMVAPGARATTFRLIPREDVQTALGRTVQGG